MIRAAIDARLILPTPTGIRRAGLNLLEGLARLDSQHEYIAISLDGDI